jgi:hypothetical protein
MGSPGEKPEATMLPLRGTGTPQPRSALAIVWPMLTFIAPYLLLMVWFHAVDVYDWHFSDTGAEIFVYNCSRVLFIFYLFWMIETAGLALLRVVASKAMTRIGRLERLTCGFFVGAFVWHIALLFLGYFSLYTVPVALVITVPVVAASFSDVRATYRDVMRSVRDDGAPRRNFGPGPLGWLVAAIAALDLVVLLLVKGLYPGGGHDYYTHYFYYFQAVIKNHSLWPNDVWYHYYYDKGAGLYFLGILLTDPLAPQLVTFSFFVAATSALYLLLRRIAPGTLWPLVGVVQFIGIYIYTPGSSFLYWGNGGWGEFQKTHELVAALVVGALWATIEALSSAGAKRRLWLISAAATIATSVIINVTIGAFFGGLFMLLTLYNGVRRRLEQSLICIVLGAAASLPVVLTLILNQWTTGLADDQGILLFWHFANLEKLARWGVLPLIFNLIQGLQGMTSGSVPVVSTDSLIFLVQSFRLDLVAPMLIGGLIFATPSLLRGRGNEAIAIPLTVIIAATLTFTTIALVVGRAQQVSFYRYASFATSIAIVSGILAWNAARSDDPFSRLSRNRLIAVVAMAVCALTYFQPRATLKTLNHGVHFAFGAYSIDTAYQTQTGLPPFAIYSGARGAYQAIGPGIPIWALFNHAYCMLPGCLVGEYPGFILTRDWYSVMYGTPQEAEKALQVANHNYFLFTREDSITDGTSTLLTWLGPDVTPLDPAWLAQYRSAVERSPTVAAYPYQGMKHILSRINSTSNPSSLIAPY